MTSIENNLRGADADAGHLGHAIVWTTVGEHVAVGRCSGCGRGVRVAVASPHNAGGEFTGPALRESCTHDYRWKKPALHGTGESVPSRS